MADLGQVPSRAFEWRARIERTRTAERAMWFAWPLGLAVMLLVGRHQWFIRDDWAFLFGRDRTRLAGGIDAMLLAPQDGHWMTWPILVFRAIDAVFGAGSYWPYLLVLFATHIGIVLLARTWMRRVGVSAWITTLLSTVLLVFGAGWENVLFAVQITYNFSLLAFLGQALLVDHDGPIDRRDGIGVVISLVGVSSSGFGPFFGFGIALLLVLRRRWKAAALAVGPQAVAWVWWWLTWGADPPGEQGTAGPMFVAKFVAKGMTTTAGSLTGVNSLGGGALLLCLAMACWPGTSRQARMPIVAFLATAFVMYAGIAARREVFGLEAAAWSRYQYVAAVLIAPALGLGLDQAARFAPWARWLPRVLLLFAIGRNIVWMVDRGDHWADLSANDRSLFALVAGSPEHELVPPDRQLSETSPDVWVGDLPTLVSDDAIEPTAPTTAEQRARVLAALAPP